MDTKDKVEEVRWGAAVDQAVVDKAVGVYFSLDRLLSQLPGDIRELVREEMWAFRPLPDAWFCYAFVRVEEALDTWRIYRRPDRPDVLWFLAAVSQADYLAAIRNIENILTTQRDTSAFN